MTDGRTTRDPAELEGTSIPEALRRLSGDRVFDVDVREDLRRGSEPFSRIMAARAAMPEGCVLRVRAPFEPVPLYGVMARHGLTPWTEQLAADDWRVWFHDPVELNGAEGEAPPIQLDVRPIPPRDKHSTIFQVFDGLAVGDAFVLINDHDPAPLRYQFEAEHTDRFGWEYLEQGPQIWRVRISRS